MRLKELRGSTSQTFLAKKLNIPQPTYSKYERGDREPNIELLCKIADYYGVSLDYLCEHKAKNQDLGYLTQPQIEIIRILKQLNEQNTIRALGYLGGLLAGQ